MLDHEPGASAPPEWIISQVCESFQCPPSVAVAELEADPALVFAILELRQYADARRAIEQATSPETHPPADHPMVQAVYETIAAKQAEVRGRGAR